MKAKVWVLFDENNNTSDEKLPAVRALEVVATEFGHDISIERVSVKAAADMAAAATQLDAPSAALVSSGVDKQQLLDLRKAWSLDVRAWSLGLGQDGASRGVGDLLVVSDAPDISAKAMPASDEGERADRAFRASCRLAQQRWGLLTEVEGLSFQTHDAAATDREFPDVSVTREPLAVAAQSLSQGLRRYDVVLGGHTFAEWLVRGLTATDSAAMSTQLSLGETTFGLYQPAGNDAYRSILTAATLLRHSLGLGREAVAVEDAVRQTRTASARAAVGFAERQRKSQGSKVHQPSSADAVANAVLGILSNDLFYSRAV